MKKALIAIVVVLGIGAGLWFIMNEPESRATESTVVVRDTGSVGNTSALTSAQLPEDAPDLDTLPADYLASITAPVASSIDDRLNSILDELHTGNSGDYVRQNFSDLDYLFSWQPEGEQTRRIFPFYYYYSQEADTTFVICNINKTVAVCDGLQDGIIDSNNASHCELAKPFADAFVQ